MKKKIVLFALTAALASSTASAQVLLNDNFNGANGGVGELNYGGFVNWTVTGQVDLVQDNTYGIRCGGNAGLCVDLDGTSGPGKMTTAQAFAFGAGDVMQISFAFSGSRRSTAFDPWLLELDFGVGANIGSYMGTGGLAPFSGVMGPTGLESFSSSIGGMTPFSTWTMQFTAVGAGSVRYSIDTSSGDNLGPLLDDVVVERVQRSVVTPEPSTWAMLAFGMGALGVAARRRVRTV